MEGPKCGASLGISLAGDNSPSAPSNLPPARFAATPSTRFKQVSALSIRIDPRVWTLRVCPRFSTPHDLDNRDDSGTYTCCSGRDALGNPWTCNHSRPVRRATDPPTGSNSIRHGWLLPSLAPGIGAYLPVDSLCSGGKVHVYEIHLLGSFTRRGARSHEQADERSRVAPQSPRHQFIRAVASIWRWRRIGPVGGERENAGRADCRPVDVRHPLSRWSKRFSSQFASVAELHISYRPSFCRFLNFD